MHLHEDLWCVVAQFLCTNDLLNVMLCSAKIKELCDDEFEWTQRVQRHFPRVNYESNYYNYAQLAPKALYKSLRSRLNGTHFFNTGDYFLPQLAFGTRTKYHYLLELDTLESNTQFASSKIRALCKTYFPKNTFYASEIEFFKGKTIDITNNDQENTSEIMWTHGVKWGGYLSMFQLFDNNGETKVINVLAQVTPDSFVIDGVWRNPDYHGLFASLKTTNMEHAFCKQTNINAEGLTHLKQNGTVRLMEHNYKQHDRRKKYKILHGRWRVKLSNQPVASEMQLEFMDSPKEGEQEFILDGVIRIDDKIYDVYGNTFHQFISLSFTDEEDFYQHIIAQCTLENDLITGFSGFIADRSGIIGVCSGEEVGRRLGNDQSVVKLFLDEEQDDDEWETDEEVSE